MYSGLDAGGVDMIIDNSTNIETILKSLLTGYDMKVNNTISKKAISLMNNDMQRVIDGFMEQMQNEAYYIVGVDSYAEAYEYAENTENPVVLCDINGKWNLIN